MVLLPRLFTSRWIFVPKTVNRCQHANDAKRYRMQRLSRAGVPYGAYYPQFLEGQTGNCEGYSDVTHTQKVLSKKHEGT